MAHLHRTAASLRISGDSLNPDEISQVLCCQPTEGYLKGETVRGLVNRRKVIKKTGAWMLDADDLQPGNLDEQIKSIFEKLPNELDIWQNLSSRFKMDLFCGFFMEATDEGLGISPKALRLLAERCITLEICIYAPGLS